MVPIVITAGDLVKSVLLLTIVWRPEMIVADVVTGSIVFQGIPPCPCLPDTPILRSSLLAAIAAARTCNSVDLFRSLLGQQSAGCQ